MCFLQSQGSDPSTYEMVQKIHTLQRKLIQKTEEVIIQYKHSKGCTLEYLFERVLQS